MSHKERSILDSNYGSISKIPRLLRDLPTLESNEKKVKFIDSSTFHNSNGTVHQSVKSETTQPETESQVRFASAREKRRDSSSPIDENVVYTQEAICVPDGGTTIITYHNLKVIGTGSFGVVYVAELQGIAGQVAIKKVLQDERFKNRELQILQGLRHPNVITLHYYFYSTSTSKPGETYLNLVQEYLPQTLSRLVKHYWRIRQSIPLVYIKLYSFQLLRGLAYIHHNAVCHRDIKPQNLIINPESGVLKIIDFGSAKVLDPGEPNVSYICSRYYRAPELIFGATHYTVQIDMWSAGCVIGELLLGRPLFPGGSGVDQLVEIIKVLGTPTPEQVLEMNPQYSEFKFPTVSGCPWEKVIRHQTHEPAFSILNALLVYSPTQRQRAADILNDSFFADLIFPPPGHPASATGHLPSGRPAPQFPTGFTASELSYLPSELVRRIRECQRAVSSESRRLSLPSGNSDAEPLSQAGQLRTPFSVRIGKPSLNPTLQIREGISSFRSAGGSHTKGASDEVSDQSMTSSLPLHSLSGSSMTSSSRDAALPLIAIATRRPVSGSYSTISLSSIPTSRGVQRREYRRNGSTTSLRPQSQGGLQPQPPSMVVAVGVSGGSRGVPPLTTIVSVDRQPGTSAGRDHIKPPPPTTVNSESISSATAEVTRSGRLLQLQEGILSQSLQHSVPLSGRPLSGGKNFTPRQNSCSGALNQVPDIVWQRPTIHRNFKSSYADPSVTSSDPCYSAQVDRHSRNSVT